MFKLKQIFLFLVVALIFESFSYGQSRTIPYISFGREIQGGGDMTDQEIRDDFLRILYSFYFLFNQRLNLPLRLKDGSTLDFTLELWKEIHSMHVYPEHLKVVKGPLRIQGRKAPVDARTTHISRLTEIDRDQWRKRADNEKGRIYLGRLAIHELMVRLGAEDSLTYNITDDLLDRAPKITPIHSVAPIAGSIISEFKRAGAPTVAELKSKQWNCKLYSTRRPTQNGSLYVYDQYYSFDGCGFEPWMNQEKCKTKMSFSNSKDIPLAVTKSQSEFELDGPRSKDFILSAAGEEMVSYSLLRPEAESQMIHSLRMSGSSTLLIEYSELGVIEWPLVHLPGPGFGATTHQYPPSAVFSNARRATAYAVCE